MTDCVKPSILCQEVARLLCIPEIYYSVQVIIGKESDPEFGFPYDLHFSVLPDTRILN
jgi:hypothetical protein